jgi:hypothetical protein
LFRFAGLGLGLPTENLEKGLNSMHFAASGVVNTQRAKAMPREAFWFTSRLEIRKAKRKSDNRRSSLFMPVSLPKTSSGVT